MRLKCSPCAGRHTIPVSGYFLYIPGVWLQREFLCVNRFLLCLAQASSDEKDRGVNCAHHRSLARTSHQGARRSRRALPTNYDHGGQSPPYLTRFMDLTWIPQLNTDQVRTPPSGEKCGLEITPAVAFTPPVDTGNKQTKQQASQ